MNSSFSVTPEALARYRQAFSQNPLSQIAARALSKTDLDTVCFDPETARTIPHSFSLEIPTLEACDQKNSGRCWLFAALNLLREKVAKDLGLEDFQLSQTYLFFYDQLEKSHTFLRHILDTADRDLDDRYLSRLLSAPIGDGGWWEYFVGLCCKYGIVPQEAMPETHQSCNTVQMSQLLNMQLRKDALILRKAAARGTEEETLHTLLDSMLSQVYNVLAICLGTPPETFDFEYVDREKHFHADRGLTPKAFYDRYLNRDLHRIVTILHAPVPLVPYGATCYTQGEESIYGSYQAKRLNLPLEDFKAAVLRQLEAGEPVWFVCDCDYYGSNAEGIWDTGLFDYETPLGLDLSLTKGELLSLRQCSLNHAMVFTGVNLVEGKPNRWKVQNSWGTDKARKGYFVISDRWFDRYVYTASIDRTYLTPEQNRQFDAEPLVLPPWNILA